MKKKIDAALIKLGCRAHRLTQNKGEGYVSFLIKMLIAIVAGALLLGLIVGLINTLWPELAQRIMDLFTGGGTTSTPASSVTPTVI